MLHFSIKLTKFFFFFFFFFCMADWIFFNEQLILFSRLIENEPLFYSLYISVMFVFGTIEVSRKCKKVQMKMSQPLPWTKIWLGQSHAGYLYRTNAFPKASTSMIFKPFGF